MNNILKAYLLLLGNVSSAYSGAFRTSLPEIKNFREEVKNLDFPSPRTDKQNLKKDCNSVARDYKKAFDKYKK